MPPILLASAILLLLSSALLFALTGPTRDLHALSSAANMLVGLLTLRLARLYTDRRRFWPWAALAAAPLLILGALLLIVVELGETVVLRTTDPAGRVTETRLWVTDYAGAVWIGAGTGEQRHWFQNLMVIPRVELVRSGVTHCYIAEPTRDRDIQARLLRLNAENYPWGGLASDLGNRFFFRESRPGAEIFVRLDPCSDGPYKLD